MLLLLDSGLTAVDTFSTAAHLCQSIIPAREKGVSIPSEQLVAAHHDDGADSVLLMSSTTVQRACCFRVI